MIRINLLGETKDYSIYYFFNAVSLLAALAVTLTVCLLYLSNISNEKADLLSKQDNLKRQETRLAKKTKEVEGLEEKKKLLSSKLSTIARLKALKQAPVLVLDALTREIPERAWVDTVSKRGETMEFRGVALDNQTVSVFIKELNTSPFFSSVDLIFSRQIEDQGVALKEFSLSGKLEDALKANNAVLSENSAEEKKEEVK